MTSGLFSGDIMRGLALRVLFFLTLALLPIGLIAVLQTRQISAQENINAELSLLAVTEQSSLVERQILQEGFSAAHALASVAALHRDDLVSCRNFFTAYQRRSVYYSLVGYVPVDGIMRCSSLERVIGFSQNADFQASILDPKVRATVLETRDHTGRRLMMISAPVYHGRQLTGFAMLALRSTVFDGIEGPSVADGPKALLVFNDHGRLISTSQDWEDAEQELPQHFEPKQYFGGKGVVFSDQNSVGIDRVYAVQPLVSAGVYAVGVWPKDTPFLERGYVARFGTILPIVMWAASLIVAFWALNRLAIRHIRNLGRQMRRFGINRHLPRKRLGHGVPVELIEMEQAFIRMGDSILKDEAAQEDSIRQKNMLLKEVHHRVKNNLQLISSIMNMQIRQAKTPDAGLVLRRLQERILSLATVHKNLYQSDDLTRLDAKDLLNDVIDQLLNVALTSNSWVEVTRDLAQISLDPDDAGPLSLLVSEALTNALKHVVRDGTTKSSISISLVLEGNETARLSIENSLGGEPEQEGTGLGSKLIEAFARQLRGTLKQHEAADRYRLSLTFPVPGASKPLVDY